MPRKPRFILLEFPSTSSNAVITVSLVSMRRKIIDATLMICLRQLKNLVAEFMLMS